MNQFERFMNKVDKSGDCWEWTAARDKDGYGTFWWDGRTGRSPRFAWEHFNGQKIPDGLLVRHTCDNPPCVNPDHLVLGTPAQNNADQIERGRTATGDRNGSRRHPECLRRGPDHPNWSDGGCANGHPAERRYTAANGERRCTDCNTARVRRMRARKAAS